MIEGVQGEAQVEKLLCFVCTRPSADFFTLRAAEMPPRSGCISGLAVCTPCMNRMTRNALSDWDEEINHVEAP